LDKGIERVQKIKHWKQKLYKVIKFTDMLRRHQNLYGFVCVPLVSFEELFRFIDVFETLHNETKHQSTNLQMIGILESMFTITETCGLTDYSKERLFQHNLINTIRNEIRRKQFFENKLLVEPMELEYYNIYGFQIVELTTQAQLNDESYHNNHCVSGYSSKLSDTIRIFSIRYGNVRHTVEVAKIGITWEVRQSKGYNNCSKAEYDPKIKKGIERIENYICQELDKQSRQAPDDWEIKLDEILDD
jgi:hypothetical protein